MKSLATIYGPHYPTILTYMLQNTDYSVGAYTRWYWRTTDFSRVMRHHQLELTPAARILRAILWGGMMLQLAAGLAYIVLWLWQRQPAAWQYGLALVVSYPVVWAHLIAVPVAVGRWLVIGPRHVRMVRRSASAFESHRGLRVALVGSYGKAALKELLTATLGAGLKVAATLSGKTAPVNLAAFADTLTGDEDVLIIEYGEGAPGDVTRFAHQTVPTHGVITGLAPVRLDRYKSVEAAGRDMFSLSLALPVEQLYINGDSEMTKPFVAQPMRRYDSKGALGWRVSDINVSF
jgi:hypothetical protein